MLVLGIDPGSVITGYGVVECRGRNSRMVAGGTLRPDAGLPFARRLLEIHDGLLKLIETYSPDEVAVENAFYRANVKTLMKMCEARGAILVALAKSELPVFQYAPREVKQAVVGRGGASKEQVQFMIRNLFGQKRVTGPYDVTDALAVAVCHANRLQSPGGRVRGETAAERERPAALQGGSSGHTRAGRTDRLMEKLEKMGVEGVRAARAKRRDR
ncbi:MAG: crossover junction endodeoxyribonuclease RuvC [Gemmatimonadota bacterium]|nr:crossover junction endodeoxyribonuclease RuvC [Gemmatimonadota bacterium]